MKTTLLLGGFLGISLLLGAGVFGHEPAKSDAQPAREDKPKRVEVGKNVFFENDGGKRRVLINAYVCLREGQLEQLLTRMHGKEHEAILAADVDARHINAALLLTGARPGAPVKYDPKYVPPTGPRIRVTLQYEEKGKTVTVAAQKWVRVGKTKKDLPDDWVFTGSRFVPNRLEPEKPEYFLANDGDIICVANFEGALLDLPIASSKDNADLAFEAHTERIPPKETKVTIILEPITEKK